MSVNSKTRPINQSKKLHCRQIIFDISVNTSICLGISIVILFFFFSLSFAISEPFGWRLIDSVWLGLFLVTQSLSFTTQKVSTKTKPWTVVSTVWIWFATKELVWILFAAGNSSVYWMKVNIQINWFGNSHICL